MSNKTQLQLNNETLGSILSNVLGLPSQENLKHGAYVWAKYTPEEITKNVTLILNEGQRYGNGTIQTIAYITPSNVFAESIKTSDFNNGTATTRAGSVGTISGNQIYLPGGSILNLEYQPAENRIYMDGNTSYNNINYTFSEITIPEVITTPKNFINYVIDDAIDAYPDGGTQDGYWYEKVTVYSERFELGTITLATSQAPITISHTVSNPKAASLFPIETLINPAGSEGVGFLAVNGKFISSHNSNGVAVYNGMGATLLSGTLTDTTFECPSFREGGGLRNYAVGTYMWIVIGE